MDNIKLILEEKEQKYIEKEEIELLFKGVKLERYLQNIKNKREVSIEDFKELINKIIEKKGIKYFLEKLLNYIITKFPELSRILAIVIDDNKKVKKDKSKIYNYWLRVNKINQKIKNKYKSFDDIGISKTICKNVLDGNGKVIYKKDIKKNKEYRESSICKKIEKEETLSIISGCIYLRENTSIIVYMDKIYKNTQDCINKNTKDQIKLFLENLRNILENEDILLSNKIKEIEKYSKYLSNIIGISDKVIELKNKIIEFSKSNIDIILIYGETGTGKKEVCESINKIIFNNNKKTYKVIQACKEGDILEIELFGYKGSSFTSSDSKDRKGILEETSIEKGIFILDNIQYISKDLQKRLLEVIENKYINRVGDLKKIDISGIKKFIFITNEDIEELKKKGNILEDFYYRINKAILYVPPLRERKSDIPLLIKHFIKKYSKKGEEKEFTQDLIEYLQNKEWEGNIRELEREVEKICNIINDDIIDLNCYLEKFNKENSIFNKENIPNNKINNYYNYKIFIKEKLVKNNWKLSKKLIEEIENICDEKFGVKIKKDTIYKIKYELVLEDIEDRVKKGEIKEEDLKNKDDKLLEELMNKYSIKKKDKMINLINNFFKKR